MSIPYTPDQQRPLAWQLHGPARGGRRAAFPPASPRLLAELSAFRGRVLYAEGRRPNFALGEGAFSDDDPLDFDSFHVTVRDGDELVACVRVTPLAAATRGATGLVVGPERFDALAARMNVTHDECIEGGRWIVAPRYRGALGRTLVLCCWSLGRWLNRRRLFAVAGTRDGQVLLIQRLGGQLAPGVEVIASETYDDELVVIYFDLTRPPRSVEGRLPAVDRLLGLEGADELVARGGATLTASAAGGMFLLTS